jgi:eukaryotic-like serine/threonine-protein kinase
MEGLLDIPVVSVNALGDYQLVAEIGRGGMADVYLALAPAVNGASNQVVIKQLRSDVVEDDDFRAMFLDEARLAKTLDHPNIVKTIEVGKDGDACFIVMEFLDGQPLSRVRGYARKSGAETPLSIHLRILSDVLCGLHYVHELIDHEGAPLGVVHRDVTPQNIFVTYDGQVKVVDFGIAKGRARHVETRVGVVKGKLSYIAPENVRGDHVDRRSDIFSVGVLLWEAATGRRFWQGLDELAIYHRLVSGELPTQSGAADMSPQVFAIVQRALAPNPDHRFATAAEMRSAIAALPQLSASSSAVSGYLYQLFVEERRRFHKLLQEEVGRLESGNWPTELPSLRPESLPSPTPAGDRNDVRSTPTVRPGHPTPSSFRTSPTVRTSFSSQSTMTAVPIPTSPGSARLLVGLAAATVVMAGWMVLRNAPRTHVAITAATAAAIPLPSVVETASPSPAPPADPPEASRPLTRPSASQPIAVSAAPLQVKHARPYLGLVKPAAKKPDPPDGFPDLARGTRPKRLLDADDPWTR